MPKGSISRALVRSYLQAAALGGVKIIEVVEFFKGADGLGPSGVVAFTSQTSLSNPGSLLFKVVTDAGGGGTDGNVQFDAGGSRGG